MPRTNRPFPWLCVDCFTRTVVPTVREYTTKVKHNGVIYELHFPEIEIPSCQTCGETVITAAVDEQINQKILMFLYDEELPLFLREVDAAKRNNQTLVETAP